MFRQSFDITFVQQVQHQDARHPEGNIGQFFQTRHLDSDQLIWCHVLLDELIWHIFLAESFSCHPKNTKASIQCCDRSAVNMQSTWRQRRAVLLPFLKRSESRSIYLTPHIKGSHSSTQYYIYVLRHINCAQIWFFLSPSQISVRPRLHPVCFMFFNVVFAWTTIQNNRMSTSIWLH